MDPAASDSIPPTTGTAAPSALPAALTAAASTLPLARPVMARYAVNRATTPFSARQMNQLMHSRNWDSLPSPAAHSAVLTATKAYVIGISTLRIRRTSTSMNSVEPT